ncbi:MAG TPA: ABC transporter permease [Candidatus Polarisedimenticolia bacterium]|nr:ABC transporter permease [Candidatus Polarisedimenticolia bacterium]
MANLGMDLRFALRMLFKSPAVSLIAVLMLAIGIGANTAIFSVVNTVLLNPLPYRDADRLVVIADVQPGLNDAPSSYPEYLAWKEQGSPFEAVAACFITQSALTGDGEPESLRTQRVSATYLPMLGVSPILGRSFEPAEETPQGERVVLIGEALWRRHFNADPRVLGRPLTLDREAFTVIGVVPESMRLRGGGDLFVPLRLDTTRAPLGLHFLMTIGRLRDGLTPAQAGHDADAIAARLIADKTVEHGVRLIGLKERVVGDVGATLFLLMGALGCLLMIVCANIASLLLARAATRQREVAVRLAVGAGRARLVRQFLVESLALSAAGGLLGVLFAWWGVDLFSALPAFDLPRIAEVRIDGVALGFTLALTVTSAILFGLAPAVQAAATNLNEALKATARGDGGRGRQRFRNALVVGEVSLSLVLLIGAGLLVRSLLSVLSVERGFETRGVLTMQIGLARRDYDEPARQRAFYEDLLSRTSALPGVEGAALTNHPPLDGGNTNGDILVEGYTPRPDEVMLSDLRRVSPDYFRVMQIPLRKGRWFSERDGADATAVAVVNQAFVDRFFKGADPIGRRVNSQWDSKGWQEVVGVVGNVRHDGLDLPILPELYVPLAQAPMPGMVLFVRSPLDPPALAAAVRAQVHGIDANLPIFAVRTMDDILSASVGARRATAALLGAFSCLALFLAAVGLYGVLAYWVAQRRREIGIRMALGARTGDVLRLVVGHGLGLTLVGVVLGLGGGLLVGRLITGLLFGVTAHDPIVLAGLPLLVTAVTLAACWIPARRAARVDPMVALRYE